MAATSLCSIRLVPEDGATISNLEVFSIMHLMEKRLRCGRIGVAQILTPTKMYSGVVERAKGGDKIEWTELDYTDCFASNTE